MAESPESQAESHNPLSPGKVSLEDFTLIKVIGKGTYGKVMLVRHKKVS
jgi:serine/threonine protein kinase